MCDSGSVGRAPPCQGGNRGFESRLSLFKVFLIFGQLKSGIPKSWKCKFRNSIPHSLYSQEEIFYLSNAFAVQVLCLFLILSPWFVFIAAGNEPKPEGTWQVPRGSNTIASLGRIALCSVSSLMPRCLQQGCWLRQRQCGRLPQEIWHSGIG